MLPTEDVSPQPAAPREKKVVVHIVRGRLAGLRRIVGHIVLKKGDELPPRFDNVPTGEHGKPGTVLHAGTYPRYVLYREWHDTTPAAPVMNTFNPAQR